MDSFERFWSAYPKRVNAGKHAAKLLFNKLVTKEKVPAEEIINGARCYADHCQKNGTLGTEFIAMAKTWLNQRRWEDYQERIGTALSTAEQDRLLAKYRAKLAAST